MKKSLAEERMLGSQSSTSSLGRSKKAGEPQVQPLSTVEIESLLQIARENASQQVVAESRRGTWSRRRAVFTWQLHDAIRLEDGD